VWHANKLEGVDRRDEFLMKGSTKLMKVPRVKLGNTKVMSSNLKKDGNELIIQSKQTI